MRRSTAAPGPRPKRGASSATGSALKLLLVRRGGLGDTLLMLPLLACLRRAHPGAELHFAGIVEFAAPLLRFGVVDAVHSVEDFALWNRQRATERLREFDTVFGDEPEFVDTAIDPNALREGVPAGLQFARAAGFEPHWPEDSWLVSPRRRSDRGASVLAPGSGGRHKCAPLEHWLALAARLPRPPIVVVGPAEVERDDPRGWRWPVGTTFFAEASVADLVDLLGDAARYYGHDSGTTHLAAALGVPTTAFFVATDPAVWAPVGPHVQIERVQVAGRTRA